MNRRTVALVLAVLLAVTVVVSVVLAITGSDDGDVVAGPATTTTTTAALEDTAQELVDRLAEARKKPLHVVYTGGLAASPGVGKLTVEIWWDGELTRQDITAEAPEVNQQQSSFALPSGNVMCVKGVKGVKGVEAEWACQRSASAATAAGKPGGIIDALVAQLNGRQVTSEKAKVGDTDADCYTLDKDSTDVVCLREDGVPVRLTFGGSELLATSVTSDVDDEDFEPPAEPTELPARPTTPTTEG